MEQLSLWENFLGELRRNIEPRKKNVIEKFTILKNKGLFDDENLEKLVAIREMALYEEGIIEFLHPPTEWKQANIKAEIVHFGTLTEAILIFFLKALAENDKLNITVTKSKLKLKQGDKETVIDRLDSFKITFSQAVEIFTFYINEYKKDTNNNIDDERRTSLDEIIRVIKDLREQRNKVHFSLIRSTGQGEDVHESFRLVTIRKKIDSLIDEIIKIIN